MKIINKMIIILFIIIIISIFYLRYIKKVELIKVFGFSFFLVMTNSMNPTVNSGELIVILENKEYKKGDIITYIDEDNLLVTHRIVEIDNNVFITRGDGNNINDNPCSINKIQGKMVLHSKILGLFILYLIKPLILFFLIIIICNDFKEYIKIKFKNKT